MEKILLPVFLIALLSCSEIKKESNESYDAGFKTIRTTDKSRIYKPGTDTTDYLYYRPIDIDLWYPAAVAETDSPVMFRNILGLLETRANYYTASDNWTGVTQQVAQSFCDGFKCSDTARLLNFRTNSYRDAPPVAKQFPLVIYMCAFNGMSFENFSLFEELARKGFVVLSVSSVGRFPGDMTMKTEDLLEQVKDAVVAMKAIKNTSNTDFSGIAILGYSWGGLSGAVLAGQIPDVKCLISLDGSEFHHYGESEEEDSDFNATRDYNGFQALNLSIPYLRLESSPALGSGKADSVFNFSGKLSGEKYMFKIDSAGHEDFSCLSSVVRVSGSCTDNQHFITISKLILTFLQDQLKNTRIFSQAVEMEHSRIIKVN